MNHLLKNIDILLQMLIFELGFCFGFISFSPIDYQELPNKLLPG